MKVSRKWTLRTAIASAAFKRLLCRTERRQQPSMAAAAVRQDALDVMRVYRAKRDMARRTVLDSYAILGFISSGTYGRVYKARIKPTSVTPTRPGDLPGIEGEIYAIKKFKPDKEGEVVTYTGISQSAAREISLNRDLHHRNLAALREVILEEKSIYMVFEYAEHDFLQIIHHHSQTLRSQIPTQTLKALLHQLLCGLHYLHSNFVLHRDLKPANILVTSSGVVKIGDLGLARLWHKPLAQGGLFGGDKVVVTIWYRAPELILGARHYTAAIDIWAIGCIYAELLSLRPIFKGDEAKIDSKKQLPFQRDQMGKICEVLGPIDRNKWPTIIHMPEYRTYMNTGPYPVTNSLPTWYKSKSQSASGFDLLTRLFEWDPAKRITAKEALTHQWFQEGAGIGKSVFEGSNITYPTRRVSHEDNGDAKMGSQPPTLAGTHIANSRLPASSNFRPATGQPGATIVGTGTKRTRLR